MTTTEVEPRRPGRPRSVEVDEAILRATLDLLAAHGPTGTSVEAVAAAAGVGKAAIYRRWSTKDDLVGAALVRLNDELPPVPDGLSTRDTLVTMLDAIRRKMPDTLSGRIMPHILGCRASEPHLVETYYDVVIEPRRERFRGVLRRAVAAGELRADADVDLMTTMLVGPVVYATVMRAPSRTPSSRFCASVVDTVLTAFAA